MARIDNSCRALYGAGPSWQLHSLIQGLALPVRGLYRLRIVYDPNNTETTLTPYTIRPVKSLRLVDAIDMEYQHKFEDRAKLNAAFSRRGDSDDVLLVRNGCIADTSYANISFSRGGQWFTPDTCLLNGTMRQLLIRDGLLTPMRISVDDLVSYDQFRLINAMLRTDAEPSDVSNIS